MQKDQSYLKRLRNVQSLSSDLSYLDNKSIQSRNTLGGGRASLSNHSLSREKENNLIMKNLNKLNKRLGSLAQHEIREDFIINQYLFVTNNHKMQIDEYLMLNVSKEKKIVERD